MDLTSFLEVVLTAGLLVICIFGFLHLGPLSLDEVLELSEKRRTKEIRQYFTYVPGPVSINTKFKKKMRPDGELRRINDSLGEFPSRAAGLMKGKKHEWVICAFERGRSIDLVWLNKGVKAEVSIGLDVNEIVRIARSAVIRLSSDSITTQIQTLTSTIC